MFFILDDINKIFALGKCKCWSKKDDLCLLAQGCCIFQDLTTPLYLLLKPTEYSVAWKTKANIMCHYK